MQDSQLLELSYFLNENYDNIKLNIINDVINNREQYTNYIDDYDNYTIKLLNNFVGDNITLIAASTIYEINIRINNDMDYIINENKPIDLYLEYKNNSYNGYCFNLQEGIVSQETVIEELSDIVLDLSFDEIHEDKFSSKWSLWINNKNCIKSSNWLDTIKKITDITNIENFWQLFNNIPEPSNLDFPSDYYFFKDEIIPMWEDNKNKDGGKMTIILKKNKDDKKLYLDKIWLYTILGCIGEQFDDSDFICGLVLNIRKHQDRINIWINTSNKEYITRIGLRWKNIIENNKISISFIKHDDTINYII